MGKLGLFVIIAVFLCGTVLHCGAVDVPGLKKKSWSYTPISVNSSTSDETKFKADVSVKRIARTELAFVGTMLINYDINDSSMTIEASAYRSATSQLIWKLLPFMLKKQGPTEFMNGFYKQMLMSSLANCSNFPVFEKFELPFEKQEYKLENCKIAIDNMPDHMQEGYYKLELIGHGEVEWVVELIIKIDTE